MARRRSPTAEPKKAWSMGGWALVLGLALLPLAVVAVGTFTRETVRTWDRYTAAFTDIECTPPPGEDRTAFLAEVQYLAGMPDQLSLLDEQVAAHVADAFARHPWVEKVEKVVVLPTRQVQARLRYRIPVLAVMLSDRALEMRFSVPDSDLARNSTAIADRVWVVDGYGFVLPKKTSSERLPRLFAGVGPAGGAGKLWGNEEVEAAARTAGYLRPYQNILNLISFEMTAAGLVLRTAAGTRVVWGHAPNSEPGGEVAAADKLARLLDYCSSHGDLDQPGGRSEHDVRSAEAASHRSLPRDDPP